MDPKLESGPGFEPEVSFVAFQVDLLAVLNLAPVRKNGRVHPELASPVL